MINFEQIKIRLKDTWARRRFKKPGVKDFLTFLIVTNILLICAAGLLYAMRSQEQRMRIAVQGLTDRLASELIVVHDKLGITRKTLEHVTQQMNKFREEKETLLSDVRQRDQTIHEMGVELAQLKMKIKHVDLGKVILGSKRGDKRKTARKTRLAKTPVAKKGEWGEVLAFNKEFNFVIVNLGSENGIEEGMTLQLFQDGKATSDLRVDMVDDTICAAAILAETPKSVEIGDEIKVPMS